MLHKKNTFAVVDPFVQKKPPALRQAVSHELLFCLNIYDSLQVCGNSSPNLHLVKTPFSVRKGNLTLKHFYRRAYHENMTRGCVDLNAQGISH